MKFSAYSDKLEEIKVLAKQSNTGSPRELAKQLKVSERTIQRMVQQLRGRGFPVIYNRPKNSYTLKNSKKFLG